MGVYDELSERDLDWSKATTYNLDEYLNCPIKEQTYEYFMDEMLFNNINIKCGDTFIIKEGIGTLISANFDEGPQRNWMNVYRK